MRGMAYGPDGTGVAYEVDGAGHPVVLLHGSALSRVVWRGAGYTAALAQHFRVVAVDLRGHGRSDKPAAVASYRQELLAADVLAVLDQLGIHAAHVVGYSLGGSVGFTLLAGSPTRVTSLVSLAGPFATPPGSVKRVIAPDYDAALVADGMNGLVRSWELARGEAFDPETRVALRANDPDAIRALLAAIDQGSGVSRDDLAKLRTPTLLMAGDRDDLGLRSAELAAELMPDATLAVVRGRDHSTLLRPAEELLKVTVPFLLARSRALTV